MNEQDIVNLLGEPDRIIDLNVDSPETRAYVARSRMIAELLCPNGCGALTIVDEQTTKCNTCGFGHYRTKVNVP